MKEDYHIDSCNRFYDKRTIGIAFVGAITYNINIIKEKWRLLK